MKLIIQPGDGILPLVQAINGAKKTIEILIFRFDCTEIERALAAAVGRGVFVHALIAYTNRGGERNLRKLEMRLLASGVTVARTADDLARYHGKMMIIDHRDLFLLSFNFTHLDIDHSRCIGIVTNNPQLVQEAVKLFEADTKRQPYTPGLSTFVVSPVNSRKVLSAFIQGAKKQLLIYDPEISDTAMIRLLEEREKAGVEIKIIGRLTRRNAKLAAHKLRPLRLHTRTIIRDGRHLFLGSQSLREVELGSRREVGIIIHDAKILARLVKLFEEDWTTSEKASAARVESDVAPAAKVAKKVAKAVSKELPPVAPMLEGVVKEMAAELTDSDLDPEELEATVRDAVKDVVREVVRDAIEDVVMQNGHAPAKTAQTH